MQFSLIQDQILILLSRRKVFFILIISCFLFHLPSIHLSPIVWVDEVQICEFGRQYTKSEDHTWTTELCSDFKTTQIRNRCYLGPYLHNFLYSISKSNATYRILALSILMSTGFIIWLLIGELTNNDIFIQNLCSLMFVSDIMLCQGVRGARLDIIVFFCFFSSVYIFIKGIKNNNIILYIFTGTLGAITINIWVTSLVLGATALGIFLYIVYAYNIPKNKIIKAIIFVLISFVIIHLIIQLPNYLYYNNITYKATTQSNFSGVTINKFFNYITLSFKNPILYVMPLFLIFVKHKIKYLFMIPYFVILIFCLNTRMFYVHRIIYLLPSLILMLMLCFMRIRLFSNQTLRILFMIYCLLMLTYTSVGRTLYTYKNYDAYDNSFIKHSFERFGLQKGTKIFMLDYELYFFARQYGLKSYKRWNQQLDDIPILIQREDINYLITKSNIIAEQYIKDAGFKQIGIIENQKTRSNYGPYLVFKR